MKRLMDIQEEAVRENLKNVVLFMASSSYLVSPKEDPSKEKLWVETWKRIDRFLPDLRSDLALEETDEQGTDEQGTDEQGPDEQGTDEQGTDEPKGSRAKQEVEANPKKSVKKEGKETAKEDTEADEEGQGPES